MIELFATQFPEETRLDKGRSCLVRRNEQAEETEFRECHRFIPDRELFFIKSKISGGGPLRRTRRRGLTQEG